MRTQMADHCAATCGDHFVDDALRVGRHVLGDGTADIEAEILSCDRVRIVVGDTEGVAGIDR